MILPNVRASFGRAEAAYVVWMLSRGDERARARTEERLSEEGLDVILDDPRTFNALLAAQGISTAPAPLVAYLLVRHALLEGGVADRAIADYVASLVTDFGRGQRAFRPAGEDGPEMRYLVDIIDALQGASGREAFLLRVHLGNYALWLCGLFPDYIAHRVERRGAPGIGYYEGLGASGYRMAADSSDAGEHGLDRLLRACADGFPELRTALNRIADRHLFPRRGDPVDRLLRQVSDEFRGKESRKE